MGPEGGCWHAVAAGTKGKRRRVREWVIGKRESAEGHAGHAGMGQIASVTHDQHVNTPPPVKATPPSRSGFGWVVRVLLVVSPLVSGMNYPTLYPPAPPVPCCCPASGFNPPTVAIGLCHSPARPEGKKDTLHNIEQTGCVCACMRCVKQGSPMFM